MQAGNLQLGDVVKTKTGLAKLVKKEAKPGRHTVYNLEVHQSHTYYVSNIGVLAHNDKPDLLTDNKDFQAALGQFKNTKFTHAGRAVTKHPQYFGFESAEALRKVYNTEAKINKLAADHLNMIIRNGKTTTGAGGRYPKCWKTITTSDGQAASWNSDGSFIGFRGVK